MATSFKRFDDYIYRDDRGNCAFKVGTVIMMYYFEGKSRDKMDQRICILQDFMNCSGADLNAFNPVDGGKVRIARADEIIGYFSEKTNNIRYKFCIVNASHYREGREYGEPQPYLMDIAVGPATSKLSQIICYLPAAWLDEESRDDLLGMVRRWASWIGAAHGTVGLGLQFNWAAAYQGIEAAYPYIKRHPGLEIGDNSLWLMEMQRRQDQRYIRSTNWLTLIDSGFVDALQGRASLENNLGSDIIIQDYSEGIIIQAGSVAEAGDINRGLVPTAYRAVAQALKPIRYANFQRFGIFDAPKPLDSLTESRIWVERFD